MCRRLWFLLPVIVFGCGGSSEDEQGSGETGTGNGSSSSQGATSSTTASGSTGDPGSSGSAGTLGTGAVDDGSSTGGQTTSVTGDSSGSSTGGTTGGTTGSTGGGSSSGASSTGGSASSGGSVGGTTTGSTTGTTTGDDGNMSTTGNQMGKDACGFPEDGPWVEIEYTQAGGSPQSPSWTFSNTPGWGAAQWAMTGDSWPEVWDVWQNITVSNDPIGVLAVVGPGAQLQLMIGLEELIDYDSATVCIEGRSVSTVASVLFDVYNPLTNCGASASMAHDWVTHAEGIDLGTCLQPGGGVQAVRIEPTGGSSTIGVERMRVTLHGAVF